MEGMLRELDYFEPNVVQLSVMVDFVRVFGTGPTLVQGGPIEFFVLGSDELYLDVNNSKLEIKLKITLENGNDLTGGHSMGHLNDNLNAVFMSMKWN